MERCLYHSRLLVMMFKTLMKTICFKSYFVSRNFLIPKCDPPYVMDGNMFYICLLDC
jgi:hypothetical protein